MSIRNFWRGTLLGLVALSTLTMAFDAEACHKRRCKPNKGGCCATACNTGGCASTGCDAAAGHQGDTAPPAPQPEK
jgi:hypothetical protein